MSKAKTERYVVTVPIAGTMTVEVEVPAGSSEEEIDPWRPIEDYLSLTPGEYMVRMRRGELAEHITIARWTGAEWRVRIADVERYDYRVEDITHIHSMGPIRGPGEG